MENQDKSKFKTSDCYQQRQRQGVFVVGHGRSLTQSSRGACKEMPPDPMFGQYKGDFNVKAKNS
jgi:hypothetical protein